MSLAFWRKNAFAMFHREDTMRVHVIEPIDESAMRKLRAEAEVVAWDDPEKNDLSRADAVIVRAASVTREQILAAPGLKVIGKHGVGVNAIDLVTAKGAGHTCCVHPAEQRKFSSRTGFWLYSRHCPASCATIWSTYAEGQSA